MRITPSLSRKPSTAAPNGWAWQRPRRMWLLALLICLAITMAAAFLLRRSSQSSGQSNAPAVAAVVLDDIEIVVESSGKAQVTRSVTIQAPISGRVHKLLVEPGDQVRAGQALARLDDTDLRFEVQQAQIDLEINQAKLDQTRQGTATAEELEKAQAGVKAAEAELMRARTGNVSAAEIAGAEADLRRAEARLNELRAGADAEKIATARSRLVEAQEQYTRTVADASATKTGAEESMRQAAEEVHSAQLNYSTAYWKYKQATNGDDPATGETSGNSEQQQRQYATELEQAESDLRLAESKLAAARIAFENAKQQEIANVAIAQAKIADAQAQLDALLQGPKEAVIAQAQADVDKARANLDQLRAGGTTADVAAAEARLAEAQAGLRALTAPQAAPAVVIAEAGVAQAQLTLKQATRRLDQATITAPFDGTLTDSKLVEGGAVEAGTTAFTLIDTSDMYLDLALNEIDVALVKINQPVTIVFDAFPDDQVTGVVQAVATTGADEQGVVTYGVRVALEPDQLPVKVGMTASASIVVERKDDVIQVPSGMIQNQGPVKIVQVLYGAKQLPVSVQVETGLSNDSMTEIVRCTQTGNMCLRPGDKLIAAGTTNSALPPDLPQLAPGDLVPPGIR